MTDYPPQLSPVIERLSDSQRQEFEAAAAAYFALPLHAHRDAQRSDEDCADDDAALAAILQDLTDHGSIEQAAAEVRDAEFILTGWIRGLAARGVASEQIAQRAGMSPDAVRARLE